MFWSYNFGNSPYYVVIKHSKTLKIPKRLPLSLNKPKYFSFGDVSTQIPYTSTISENLLHSSF